ncbi:hypothetical protein HN935_00665 [archaeon]|jgi:hypothetical protein|nr:hypothetical protein [archaeon]
MGDNTLLFASAVVFGFAIVLTVSMFGAMGDFSITGFATANGSVNVTINESVSLNFTTSEVNWGSGAVDIDTAWATIDTVGGVTNGTWSALSDGLIIRNAGNVNLTLNFTTGKNASVFIGGTGESYEYNVTNVDDDACDTPVGFDLNTYYDAGDNALICDSFLANKSIRVDLRLVIPVDSSQGILSDVATITYEKDV